MGIRRLMNMFVSARLVLVATGKWYLVNLFIFMYIHLTHEESVLISTLSTDILQVLYRSLVDGKHYAIKVLLFFVFFFSFFFSAPILLK